MNLKGLWDEKYLLAELEKLPPIERTTVADLVNHFATGLDGVYQQETVCVSVDELACEFQT